MIDCLAGLVDDCNDEVHDGDGSNHRDGGSLVSLASLCLHSRGKVKVGITEL